MCVGGLGTVERCGTIPITLAFVGFFLNFVSVADIPAIVDGVCDYRPEITDSLKTVDNL